MLFKVVDDNDDFIHNTSAGRTNETPPIRMKRKNCHKDKSGNESHTAL